MTKKEKQYYMNKETICYYSGCNGIEIKEIEYGIEDYVIYLSNAWDDCKNRKIHRVRIHYTDNPYFLHNSIKIPFNECIRCN